MTSHHWYLLGAALLAVLAVILWRCRRQPQPALGGEERELLAQRLPLYRQLPPALQAQLDRAIPRFLAAVRFEGCGGLELTPEMRLLIATQACLLLAGRGLDYYPGLGSVLVYPDAFLADGGLFIESPNELRLGESWEHGTVVLSWDSVQQAAAGASGGLNLVLHEFAHRLDPAGAEGPRSAAFEQAYGELRVRARRGRPSLFDPYGADSPEEFFAVATETFFEMPGPLRDRYPELYRELADFYRLDPADWRVTFTGPRFGEGNNLQEMEDEHPRSPY